MHLGEVFDREIGFFSSWIMRKSLDKMDISKGAIKKGNDSKAEAGRA